MEAVHHKSTISMIQVHSTMDTVERGQLIPEELVLYHKQDFLFLAEPFLTSVRTLP